MCTLWTWCLWPSHSASHNRQGWAPSIFSSPTCYIMFYRLVTYSINLHILVKPLLAADVQEVPVK